VSQSSTVEPAGISEPVVRALDTLILVAAASFAVSVMAVLATILAAEGLIHAVAHLSLPILMGLVVVVRGVYILLRHPQARNDAWSRASAIDSSDARLAEILTFAVPAAWLVGTIGILIRHATDHHGVIPAIGLLLPLGAALWSFATFAWIDACRDRVAAGLDESDRKFRDYWRNIGRTN
jgi:hypothetical protein